MRLLVEWRARRRRDEIARRLADARRAGHGLHVGQWRVEPAPADGREPLVAPVLAWCREVMAGSSRPFGIDRFDLTLAWATSDGTLLKRVHLNDLRPADLYGDISLGTRLTALLNGVACSSSVRIGCALLLGRRRTRRPSGARLTPAYATRPADALLAAPG